jgi:hypothetical protein
MRIENSIVNSALVSAYWDCELFLLGLLDLGILAVKKSDYDCELFQIGLKELGLA